MKPVRLVVLLIVVAGGTALYISRERERANGTLGASGTVEATEAALGFQQPGRIAKIWPREGDPLAPGDTIATLEHAELDARRAQAVAGVTAARETLRDLEAGARTEELAQAREAVRAATERVTDAKRDHDRIKRLFDGGAVSQEAYDKVRLALELATAQQNQAAQQLALLQAGPRESRVAAQRAAVAQAEASLRQVDAMIANTVLVAPFGGIVAVRDREPGETVGAGAPVVTLIDLNDRWIRIFIKEDRIGAVQVGQAATITVDTFRDRTYTGAVSFIAREAEYTPRNVQTAEERVRLVYAVKVRITADSAVDLKPGMPADVVLK